MHYERWKTHGDFTTVKKPGIPRQLGDCSQPDCSKPAIARDLCSKHYTRWQKFGDPTVTKLDRDRTPQERFWPKVNKEGPLPEYDPQLGACWLWTGGIAEGYGVFSLDGKQVRAHRMTYLWLVGEIPDECELDHLCRVRRCCNPAHLEPVSHLINVHRGISPWAINASKTHCPAGHEYDDENTYLHDGGRYCRKCSRQRNLEWYRRQKKA